MDTLKWFLGEHLNQKNAETFKWMYRTIAFILKSSVIFVEYFRIGCEFDESENIVNEFG